MVKKLNIVCILLVFIFSLSAVSAADNITDDVSTVANANENVVIDNTTTVSETSYSNNVLSDNVVSSDDSITENQENTYADLADKINNTADNSTVELNENYAYNNSDFQNYQKGIVITDNVTINGNNHNITVTGSDSAFIIKNANVTLENINFKGTTYESVVQVIDGQLTLLNCTIEDINKVSPTAGAIGDTFSVNDILTIANHVENYYKATNTLPNNVVYNGKSYTLPVISQLLGQAVLNYYANNTTDISVTKLLSAPGNPFGSFNSSINYTQKAYITNSESIEKGGFTLRFVNYCNKYNAPPNYVGANDGNLYYTSLVESFARALVYYGANTAFPEYMNYYGNIKIASSTSGVGVYSYNSNLTIKNSIIKNISGSTNGGIYVLYGNILVNNTIFDSNTANRGAAIFVDRATSVTIDNSKFTNNTATSSGTDGIVINTYMTSVNITNSNFTDNNGLSMTGLIKLKQNYESFVDNCIFIRNEAREAGVISAESSEKLTITNSKFMNNGVSTFYGFGGVFNIKYTQTEIKNSEFINNSASGTHPWGGVGMFEGATFDIINSTFINNTAREPTNSTDGDKNLGGAIYAQTNAIVNIVNSTFIENSAANKGGALYAQDSSNFIISGSKFINNTANNYGGALYSKEASAAVSVDDSYFENNSALNGGAISTESSSSSDVDNSTFVGNNANTGGAIYGDGTVNVKNSYFQNNYALNHDYNNGGALSAQTLSLENSTFVNNSAKQGGAVWVGSSSKIYNSTFINNKADDSSAISLCNLMDSATVNYNIFVNNTGNYVVNDKNSDGINLNYNYWGTNNDPTTLIYKESKTTLDKWITIGIEGNSTINAGSEYNYDIVFQGENADKLPLFNTNITLVPNVGTLNQSNVLLNNKTNVSLSANKAANFTLVIGPEYGNLATYNIESLKINSTIVASAESITYGNDAIVNVVVPSDATGNVTITVNEVTKIVNITNGKANATFNGLNATSYPVSVTYNGDDKYLTSTNTTTLTVNQASSNVDVNVENVVYGNNATIVASVTPGATGNVTFTVNDKSETVNIIDGKATLNVGNLSVANYPVEVTYNGDNNYKTSTNDSVSFNVTQATSNIDVSVDNVVYGNNVTIVASVTPGATGNVTFTVNGVNRTVNIIDGKATLNVGNLSVANYPVEVIYNGDNNYKVSKNTTSFNVTQAVPKIDINVPGDLKIGDNVTIVASLPKDVTGNVTLSIDGKNISVAIKDGVANLTVSNLSFGSHQFKVEYDGDNNYKANNESISFYVDKFDSSMSVDIPEIISGENATITVSLPKHATGNVTLTINNNNYTANVTNGVAKVNIPGLDAGSYDVTVTYSGDNEYKNNVTKYNITVLNNKDVNLNSSDIVMFYKDGTRFVGVLTDYKGNPIANQTLTFTINGRTYIKTTDVNGTASIALNLIPGTYNANVYFNGTKDYNSASVNVSVNIKSTIEGSDIVKIYQNGTQFFATFYGADGKTLANNTNVTFNINGVFYTRQTNENGTAKLTINLRPGNYTLTAINPVNNETKGFNVLVKSSIEANDLTKYYQNASKFEAKIYDKDGSLAINKTVEFNINGVVYKRDTDENGIARLAINLRPGNYTITTMYDGLSVGNNVNVLPTLETKDLSMKFQDGSKFSAITLDDQGKPLANQNVTFNVNGVFYNRTSNENGVANLNINLMPGEYIITSMWKGFETANKIKID